MSEQEPARDLRELLRIAEAAALAGAAVVRAGAGRARGEVDLKGRGDYVTEVDRDSEDAIIAVLRKRSPDIQLLAEESGGDLTGDLVWVIDPLDGTTNFVHGFPAVAVSVALLSQGRPVVGVVAAPLLDQLYRAIAGQGAWSNDGARLQVRDADPRTAIVATGFPFRKPENRERYLGVFEPALEAFEDMRRAGAAALHLAWPAARVLDGFFE